MRRTLTKNQHIFTLPSPTAVTFDFSTPDHIAITVPGSSNWRTEAHWHTSSQSQCTRLEVQKGRTQITDWREPRTGATYIGNPTYYFKPDYWVTWASEQDSADDLSVVLVVSDESLYRNVVSAILDADLFPSLHSTPYWIRAVFGLLKIIDRTNVARRLMIAKFLHVQIQTIYYCHGHWEYHGGINALRWWQWTHPFDVGHHPAWTVSVQFKSQRFFSRIVQALYFWVGRAVGMKGDYAEYNPRLDQKT